MPTEQTTPRFFYGYLIVLACFFIIFFMHGMYSTYGVFFNPFQETFNWNRTIVSGANSVAFFFDGLFAVVAGRLTDRFGPRIVMTITGLTMGLGYVLLSQIDTAWELYLWHGVIIGMSMGSANVTLLSTTARWFVKRRGLMSGLVKVGTGAGMFIMPLVASWFIAGYGWRTSYLVLGIISALCITSTAQLLKRDPAEKGFQPYGAFDSSSHGSNTIGEGLTLQEAIHTWQFWMVCALYFISWYCARTVMVHIAPHTIDLGFSAVQAASVISIIGAASIVGRVVMGGSSDRIGNKRAVLICFAVLATMLLWLHGAKELWALYVFAAIYGFSHGGFFALVSPLVAELMGTKSHGVILGLVLAISQAGGALGTVLTGRIFDITGSYHLAFIILNVMSITGLVLSGFLKPIRVNSTSPDGEWEK